MESRRLTFSLKSEGADKKHDVAYDLLKNLPKGYRADLVAQAIYEYIMSREGIHMVKEKNSIKILNLGKATSEATTADYLDVSGNQADLLQAGDRQALEPKITQEVPVCEIEKKIDSTDDALDTAIAAWFNE